MKPLVRTRLALLVLLLALPATAAIWTRSSNVVKLNRGGRTPLPNALYAARDWNAAVTGFEVKDAPPAGDMVTPRWHFYYRNTDAEAHYVAITVQCQDSQRRDRMRFSYTATLQPKQEEEAAVEIVSKLRADEWRATVFAKITIDFLSSPTG